MADESEGDESLLGGTPSAMLPAVPSRRNLRTETRPILIELPTAEMAMTLRPTLRMGNGNIARLNAPSAAETTSPLESPRTLIRSQAASADVELSPALESGLMRVAEQSGSQLGPGDHLGDRRYRLGELLSDGNMARVFRATQLKTERTVVVKVLLHAGDSRARKAAKRELDALVRVNHPNFVSVLDADVSANDMMWIATEYVAGETLRKRLTRGGRLPLPEALDIMMVVFAGLSAAHEANVLHLDLKPENILLGRGFTKICDLGTAALLDRGHRTTDRGSMVGTPEYIAPERLVMTGDLPAKPDFRCDLYSAGLCLYETVAGFHALIPEGLHDGRRLAKESMCLRQVEFLPAVIASIPTPLWELIEELLRKDPSQRPPSASAVAERLREIRATLHVMPGDLEPAPAEATVWASVGRSIWVGIAAGLMAVAVLGGALGFARGATFLRDRKPSATALPAVALPAVPSAARASVSAPRSVTHAEGKPALSAAPAATSAGARPELTPAPVPEAPARGRRSEATPKAAQAALTSTPSRSPRILWPNIPPLLPDEAPWVESRVHPQAARPTATLPKPRPQEISDTPPF